MINVHEQTRRSAAYFKWCSQFSAHPSFLSPFVTRNCWVDCTLPDGFHCHLSDWFNTCGFAQGAVGPVHLDRGRDSLMVRLVMNRVSPHKALVKSTCQWWWVDALLGLSKQHPRPTLLEDGWLHLFFGCVCAYSTFVYVALWPVHRVRTAYHCLPWQHQHFNIN